MVRVSVRVGLGLPRDFFQQSLLDLQIRGSAVSDRPRNSKKNKTKYSFCNFVVGVQKKHQVFCKYILATLHFHRHWENT